MSKGQLQSGLLEGLVPKVVMSKYGDNLLRNKTEMANVFERQQGLMYNMTVTIAYFSLKTFELKMVLEQFEQFEQFIENAGPLRGHIYLRVKY
jgi:hypothetical protein